MTIRNIIIWREVRNIVQQVLDHCTESLYVLHSELGFSILRYEIPRTSAAGFETKVIEIFFTSSDSLLGGYFLNNMALQA